MTHEASPAVTFGRRGVLALPALLGLLPRVLRSRAQRLAFEAFASRCGELADEHLAAGREFPEALLLAFAEAGARLAPDSVPRPELSAFGGYEPTVSFAPVHRAPPLVVIEWQLDPGAHLPPHSHTPGYVVSLCLEGDCVVRHFEIVGQAPAAGQPGEFRMRETRSQWLRPGHASSLTPERDGIHTFQAGPRGALGIDVMVLLPGEGDWSMIESRESSRDGFETLHTARWIGKPGR